MKRVSAFILAIMVYISCMGTYAEAAEVYVNYDDCVTNSEYIEILVDLFDINYDDIKYENYIRTRYLSTLNVNYTYITRVDALVGLMRLYKLIPDNNIELYPWTDAEDVKIHKLKYISYARELGITYGISTYEFDFESYVTKWQIETFIERIQHIENLEEYQKECPINIYDDEKTNCYLFVEPLVMEFLTSLPEVISTMIVKDNWSIRLVHESSLDIDGYNHTIIMGATYLDHIDIATRTSAFQQSFYMTLIHEFCHAICRSCNWVLDPSIELDSKIINIEMPKLGEEYRIYAATSASEYLACTFEYVYLYGHDKFKEEFPLTYQWYIRNLLIIT